MHGGRCNPSEHVASVLMAQYLVASSSSRRAAWTCFLLSRYVYMTLFDLILVAINTSLLKYLLMHYSHNHTKCSFVEGFQNSQCTRSAELAMAKSHLK